MHRRNLALVTVAGLAVLVGVITPPAAVTSAAVATPSWVPKPARDRSVPVKPVGHQSNFVSGAKAVAPRAVQPATASSVVLRPTDLRTVAGASALRLRVATTSLQAIGSRGAREVRADLTPLAGGGVQVRVVPAARHAAAADWRGSVEVSYAGWVGAADAASRLRVHDVTGCAPGVTRCVGDLVAARNHLTRGQMSIPVDSGTGRTFTLSAGASGGAGDYSATSLSPASSWTVSPSSGSFTWTYPLTAPPAASGTAPQLALSYDSSSVDGRVSSTNNQPSWVGEGFSLDVGHIDRSFYGCADDMTNGNNASHKTSDSCWRNDNASVLMNGKSSRLIRVSGTDTWRMEDDDGSRITHGTGAANGDNDGEYWVLTTTDGTRYHFGVTKRYAGDVNDTASVWSMPVAGNHSGEPCHQAAFADSFCDQAYRWNLDYVVDVHGNTITYDYARETNRYGQNLDTKSVAYDRGGYLTNIDYGQVAGTETDANVQQRLTFAVAERCTPSGAVTCDPGQLTAANQAWWPDVPFDQICTSTTGCGNDRVSATLFSRKRLQTVTSFVRRSTSLTPVSSWTLGHSFPAPGDGTSASLWLDSITRRGLVGGTVTMPPVLFGKQDMPNRVDTIDYAPPLIKFRVASIRTETGATIRAGYSAPECVSGSKVPASPDNDALRCFPSYWTPLGFSDPVLNYFHKYLVTSTTEESGVTTSLAKVTRYSYVGAPAWHYDDQVNAPAKLRTWSQFRGYQSVDTTVGDVNASTPIRTRATYFRGMDGDKQLSGAPRAAPPVTDSLGGTTTDVDEFAGDVRETITYNGAAIVSATINTPWKSPTASATDADGAAYRTATAQISTRTTIAGTTTPRTVEVVTTKFDGNGLPTEISDLGDVATTADDRCTRVTRVSNSAKNILGLTAEEGTYATSCAVTAPTPAQTISETRTYYDGSTSLTAAPVRGDATSSTRLADTSATTSGHVTMSTASFDALGRTASVHDALGRETRTAYEPADNEATTSITTTNALGHASTVTVDPAFGSTSTVKDPNGRVSTMALDPMGRTTKVWLPNRATTLSPTYSFDYLVRADAPSAVTTSVLQYKGVDRINTVTLMDGLLRPLQTQSPVVGTGRVLSDVVYDSRGLQVAARGPWFNGDANPGSTHVYAQDQGIDTEIYTAYDGAGRPTRSTVAVNGVPHHATSTVYNGDSVDTLPPAGGTGTRTVVNGRGETTELWQYHGNTVGAVKDVTRYTTNAKGQLAAITDPAGSRWTWSYDLLGRATSTTDPDKGAGSTSYDLAGQIKSTTDARGQTLTMTYDALGRLTKEATAAGVALSTRTYDTVPSAVGQLSAASRFVAGAEYKSTVDSYNTLYQPTQTTTVIPGAATGVSGTYVRKNYYNVDGTVTGTQMPTAPGLDSETWSVQRDALNRPSTMVANEAVVNGTSRNVFGEITQYSLSAVTGKSVYVTNTYDTGLHRLKTMRVDRDNVVKPDISLTYGYDPSGNITTIADVPDALTPARTDRQCFQHDYLQRLTEAWSNGATACTATPSYVASGAAPYWTSWTYDLAGNRRTEVRHGATGTATSTTTTTSTYPAVTAVRPHAPTQVSTQVGTGTPTTAPLTYDQAGNTLTMPLKGVAATNTWDEEGRLATVTTSAGKASNVYGPDGALLVKTTVDGRRTLFLGDTEVMHTPAKGTTPASTTSRRLFTFDGLQVAIRNVGTTAGLHFTPPNPQGTAAVQINASSAAIAKRYFAPFGAPRGSVSSLFIGDHGFLGGTGATTDPIDGLTHLGSREYDPALGRFLSVDPVMDPNDPQQLNGYCYSQNSPVTSSDPSGNRSVPSGGTQVGNDGKVKHTEEKSSEERHEEEQHRTTHRGGKGEHVDDAQRDAYVNAILVGDPPKRDNPWSAQLTETAYQAHVYVNWLWASGHLTRKHGMLVIDDGVTPAWLTNWAMYRLTGQLQMDVMLGRDGGGGQPRISGGREPAGSRSGGEPAGGRPASGCTPNSFTGDTLVLIENGDVKAIRNVKVGDRVLATDPETGETRAEPVTDVIRHTQREVVLDIEIKQGGVVHATERHPFWSKASRRYVIAKDLRVGDKLRTPSGRPVQIRSIVSHRYVLTAYNLSIAQLHTYYVMAGTKAVLVHNAGCGGDGWTSKGNLNVHYDKHGEEMGYRSPAEFGAAAEDLVCTCAGRRPGVLQKRDGSTNYFLDPATGEFAMTGSRGIITFYRPDDPVSYFNKQAGIGVG